MKCHEIFGRCSPELVNEIFSHLVEQEKPVYKAAVHNLAGQQKLRPVFVERKPRQERYLWLQQALSRKPADNLAAQLLQIWLLGAQRDMICRFLDALGISHDGKGVFEDLPAEPSEEALKRAISELFEKHRNEVVSVYLNAFQAMDEKGWEALDALLESDPRLALPVKEGSK
jgi:hypothetical protein